MQCTWVNYLRFYKLKPFFRCKFTSIDYFFAADILNHIKKWLFIPLKTFRLCILIEKWMKFCGWPLISVMFIPFPAHFFIVLPNMNRRVIETEKCMNCVCMCELLDGLLLFFSSIVGFFQQIINLLTVMLRRITATAQNQLNQRTIYYNLNHDMCMERCR